MPSPTPRAILSLVEYLGNMVLDTVRAVGFCVDEVEVEYIEVDIDFPLEVTYTDD
jgi:hypothetical protein